MKLVLTALLMISTLFVSAQKMPKPPKADAVGKETLWESFEKPNTYDILVRTKKIAILPASSAYYARKIDPDSVKKYQDLLTNMSIEMQKIYFESLIKNKLSAVLQNPTETNKILSEKGLLNPETLSKTPKNTVCFLLGVDAVVFIDITMEHLKSPLAQAALNSLSKFVDASSDEVAIGLRMYEKSNGDFFWATRVNEKVNSKQDMSQAFINAAKGSFNNIPFLIKK
jgi:hypothetical protein